MAFSDPTVVIKLREGESRSLIETLPDGTEKIYNLHLSNVWFVCEQLQISRSTRDRDSDDVGPSTVVTTVMGTARLNNHIDISVIGEPTNTTRVVAVTFSADDRPYPISAGDEDDDTMGLSAQGRASLLFNRADWEIGIEDQWWLGCGLHSSVLQTLLDGISSGTLYSLQVSARIRKLYTDQSRYAPVSARAHLFLRPDPEDNSLELPERACGAVTFVNLKTAPINLHKPDPIDGTTNETNPTLSETPMPPADPLSLLTARVEALQRTVGWVGGIIAAVLVFIALR